MQEIRVVVLGLIFIGIGWFLRGWSDKRKRDAAYRNGGQITEQPIAVAEPVKPAEYEYTINRSITVEKAGEKITYTSDNDFGLKWKGWVNSPFIDIKQMLSYEDNFRYIASLQGYSIIDIKRETVKVVADAAE